jgi:hypothetical protein
MPCSTQGMTRYACAVVTLMAGLAVGCSGSEGAAAPTAPTSTPTTTGSTGGAPTSPTPQSCVPAAPQNLRVTRTDSTRVFTWDAVSNVQDYFIQISHVGSSDPDIVNTNTTHTDYTWVGAGTGNYTARVYARNSCGSGPNSTAITFN